MKRFLNLVFNNKVTGNKAFRWSIYYFLMLGVIDGLLNYNVERDYSYMIPMAF